MNARDESYEATAIAAIGDLVEAVAYQEALIGLDDPATLLVVLRHHTPWRSGSGLTEQQTTTNRG